MKLLWTHPALADLIEAQHYIATESPAAAETVARRVWDAGQVLRENPSVGRPGHVEGTREWVVDRTPYLLVYRVQAETVEILRVWHARRDWKGQSVKK